MTSGYCIRQYGTMCGIVLEYNIYKVTRVPRLES